MVFHWKLSDGKSPQVSRTLICILVVLNNAVVLMVSTRHPTSKSFSPLVTVPKEPMAIGIVTFTFHSFYNSLVRSRYLSVFSYFFQFYSVVSGDSKVDNFPNSVSFADYHICHNPKRSSCVWFSRFAVGLCIYNLLVWSNFLHIFLWMTLLTQSCLASVLICCIRLLCVKIDSVKKMQSNMFGYVLTPVILTDRLSESFFAEQHKKLYAYFSGNEQKESEAEDCHHVLR